ncbi:DUF3017 domain-containing protein [Jatrophihabitans fulvus]
MNRGAATRRWIREQLAFLVVIVGLVASFLYLLLEAGHWVRGAAGMAVVVLFAALLRAVVPTQHVGMLAVRSRWLDTVLYAAGGGVTLAVALYLRLKK